MLRIEVVRLAVYQVRALTPVLSISPTLPLCGALHTFGVGSWKLHMAPGIPDSRATRLKFAKILPRWCLTHVEHWRFELVTKHLPNKCPKVR